MSKKKHTKPLWADFVHELDKIKDEAWTDVTFPETSTVKVVPTQVDQSIELDCPPGHPRPGDLYPGVIKGTGLPNREPVSKFFGNWTWDFNDIPVEEWKKVQPTIKARVTKLYEQGYIRYGSW